MVEAVAVTKWMIQYRMPFLQPVTAFFYRDYPAYLFSQGRAFSEERPQENYLQAKKEDKVFIVWSMRGQTGNFIR